MPDELIGTFQLQQLQNAGCHVEQVELIAFGASGVHRQPAAVRAEAYIRGPAIELRGCAEDLAILQSNQGHSPPVRLIVPCHSQQIFLW